MLLVGFLARTFEQETSSLGLRVLTAPNGVVGAYQQDDSLEGPLEIQESDDGEFEVVRTGEVLFTGTEPEAAFWLETQGAAPRVTGTRNDVEAWVEEQEAAEDDTFWPLALLVAGGLVVLGSVALGRDRADAAASL